MLVIETRTFIAKQWKIYHGIACSVTWQSWHSLLLLLSMDHGSLCEDLLVNFHWLPPSKDNGQIQKPYMALGIPKEHNLEGHSVILSLVSQFSVTGLSLLLHECTVLFGSTDYLLRKCNFLLKKDSCCYLLELSKMSFSWGRTDETLYTFI